MSEPPDDVVEALYAGDPKAFVATRDAAVKELRAAGRREEATAVKALGRPTVAAAGVNQAVRSGALDALWAAGDALAAAQAALLAGDADAAALREAKATHEDALGAVVELAGEGARETLRAASVDAEVREAVAGGRLVREVEPGSGAGGFGGFTGFEAAPGGRAKAKDAGRAPAEGARKARSAAKDDAHATARSAADKAEEKAARAAEKEKVARTADEAKQARAAEKEKAARAARAAEKARKVEADRDAKERAARAKALARQRKALERKIARHEAKLATLRTELDALAD